MLRTWRLASDGHYVQVFPPVLAWVGVNGVRPTHEGLGRTPVGIFTMTEAFGNKATTARVCPTSTSAPMTGGMRTRRRLPTTDSS